MVIYANFDRVSSGFVAIWPFDRLSKSLLSIDVELRFGVFDLLWVQNLIARGERITMRRASGRLKNLCLITSDTVDFSDFSRYWSSFEAFVKIVIIL